MKRKIIANLREKYFSNTQIVELKKGECLISREQENRRLFLVLEGLVVGILEKDGKKMEVFRSSEDMLVGLHSFFSRTFMAYADVIAIKDTKLTYISYDEDIVRPDAFLDDFLPVLINELFDRQVLEKKLMLEKEEALKKDIARDKLATLGQMAAGIAHELNNAIATISRNADWVAKEIYEYIRNKEEQSVFLNFEKGYQKGQYRSSAEVRKNKQKLEKRLNLPATSAKKLARIGIDESNLKDLNLERDKNECINSMHRFWEMGVAVHDILLSSKHAANVISSVKTLGGISQKEQSEVEITQSLREALTMLGKHTEGIKIIFETNELMTTTANETEIVQIWINLIKNACESLKSSAVKAPQVKIQTKRQAPDIVVKITDNGPGIPKDLQEKIFRPNFTTKKGGLSFGLGLGLSVVQKHIEEYKGSVALESKPGCTTFTVKLPISNKQ
ncbi:MAG: hypothetical protein CSB06_02205 [Bacteroidia bacterium]|nr:MAG: hypothetical protein CSB06_02205 [Bacteroidia bacterium]